MTAEITPFAFPATGQPVRTVTVDGQPWFVGRDVALALGYSNPRDALAKHVPAAHKGVSRIATPSSDQDVTIISEAGMYRLIMRSNTKLTERFQEWVTAEVLPSIRQTGSYDTAPQFEIPQTLGEALRLAASQADEIEQQRLQLAAAEPKAEAWDVLASADPDWSVREAAYILNRDPSIDTGQQRLFNELRRMRVIDSRDTPYSSHAHHVKLRPRTFTNRATNEEMPAKPQVRITAAGLAYLHKKLGGTAELELSEQVH